MTYNISQILHLASFAFRLPFRPTQYEPGDGALHTGWPGGPCGPVSPSRPSLPGGPTGPRSPGRPGRPMSPMSPGERGRGHRCDVETRQRAPITTGRLVWVTNALDFCYYLHLYGDTCHNDFKITTWKYGSSSHITIKKLCNLFLIKITLKMYHIRVFSLFRTDAIITY